MDDVAGYVSPRTCTVVDEREPPRDGGKQAPLTDFADTAAYVLIAEPGAGKTTAFETEAAKQGQYASPSATSSGSTSRSGATQRCSLTASTSRARAPATGGRRSTVL